VFIDSDSFLYLKGTKVDFERDGVNEGIKFHNPNVKAICGCGESFEVEI
jgi:iron-sulfur cluster assembly protein